MADVVDLGPHERMSVADCIGVANRECAEWQDVMVLAYDEDGALVIQSSHMSRKDAAWMLLEALDRARGLSDG